MADPEMLLLGAAAVKVTAAIDDDKAEQKKKKTADDPIPLRLSICNGPSAVSRRQLRDSKPHFVSITPE